MKEYEVKPIVCDYGIYYNDELILKLNSLRNAILVKNILNLNLLSQTNNSFNNEKES